MLENSNISPIPTYYRGFRFRSRLEARWHVFFDCLRIESQYEPEGWKLPDGTLYLPDFYLPQIRAWAEVKPFVATETERRKALQLAEGTNRLVLFLIGPPDFKDYEGISGDSGEITSCLYRLDIDEHSCLYYLQENRLFACPGDTLTEWDCTNEFRLAVYASRSARFDGTDTPQLGNEPFNLSEREMGGL